MKPLTTYTLLAITLLSSWLTAAPKKQIAVPDFTKGDKIPEGANHDWNLGPTGLRGWMYTDKRVSSDARQVSITEVTKGSPADGTFQVGDVILGVAGKAFSYDPRTEIGKAITMAESDQGQGNLIFTRWRDGESKDVTLKLPVLGNYSATAPYNCQKSQRILELSSAALAERMREPKYTGNPITRSLNALGLLATGNDQYLDLVKREAEWASKFQSEGFSTWWYGYCLMLLAEYQMATGDDSYMAGMKRIAMEAAEGQSIVGSWGHKFAGDDGRLQGYGMMNSPGLTLTIGLILAKEAGVSDPKVAEAIERSTKLLRFYTGKGSVPYGDHAPWMQTHEDNGKCGMASVLFNLLEEEDGAKFFSRMSVASHGSVRDTGHTGNYFNIMWAMPSVAQSGPNATGAWMKEYGAWYFDLARSWDGTFPHQGPAEMRNDKYANWDATGCYLIAYAQPLGKLWLTGKGPKTAAQLDKNAAEELIRDGRGWDAKNRHAAYEKLDSDTLLKKLSSWSPIIRDRAGMTLAKRDGDLVPALLDMLESPSLETRLGACQALRYQREKAQPAIPALQQTLSADDLWLRVQAAEALAAIGEPANVALPQLLEKLAVGPTDDDPRGMEQRYLCFIVFGKILKNSIDGVDRNLLSNAVAAGLKNEDGRARGTIGGIYSKLSYEELKPLLPAIHEAVATPSPSGIMFASGIQLAGLDLLAKHKIKEGMPLCLEVMEIDKWGKKARIGRCLKSLSKYGGAAKPLLPELHQLEKDLSAHKESKGLQDIIKELQKLISDIEKSTETVELRSIKE